MVLNDSLFVFIFSIIYSLMEIEIEGKNGWCSELPTAKNVLGDFTFYHLLMNILIIITFWKVFNKYDIFTIIFYITSFFLIEDFLWFVLNPCYTMKKYTKENIPWHKTWMLNMPSANIFGLGVLFICTLLSKNKSKLSISFIVFIVLTTLTILSSPFYHDFYHLIRK